MNKKLTGFAAVACLAAYAAPAAAQNIDTRAAAIATVGLFGYPSTPTYGQVFTVPAGQTTIYSFSFRTATVPATTTFQGVLMQWDTGTSRATGPVLFQSADVNTTGPTVQDVNFTIPGGASVTPGQTYVIFGSIVNSAGSGDGDWSFAPGDALAGGSFVFQNLPSQANWTASAWQTNYSPLDLGVTVNFTPVVTVPTLSEWAMIGLTLTLAGAGAAFATRRRWA